MRASRPPNAGQPIDTESCSAPATLTEADSWSANQEIPCLLCIPQINYRAHESSPLLPTRREMNLVQLINS
jgi:hypothetical protein